MKSLIFWLVLATTISAQVPATSSSQGTPNSITNVTVTGTFNAGSASATTGLLIPKAAGAIPTADGQIADNTTNHVFVWGSNGTTMVGAIAATGTGTATTCTNQAVTAVSSLAAPTCTTLTSSFLPAGIVYNNQANTYTTGLQSFASGNITLPAGAGFTATSANNIGYDTTNTNVHIYDGADGIVAPFASAPTNGRCIQAAVVSGKVTLVDSGSTNCGGGGATALSAVTAATTSNTIASGNNPQTWNWAQTSTGQVAMTFGGTNL